MSDGMPESKILRTLLLSAIPPETFSFTVQPGGGIGKAALGSGWLVTTVFFHRVMGVGGPFAGLLRPDGRLEGAGPGFVPASDQGIHPMAAPPQTISVPLFHQPPSFVGQRTAGVSMAALRRAAE
jgi:hypothetical protein